MRLSPLCSLLFAQLTLAALGVARASAVEPPATPETKPPDEAPPSPETKPPDEVPAEGSRPAVRKVPFNLGFLPGMNTAGALPFVHSFGLNLVSEAYAVAGAELGFLNQLSHHARGAQLGATGNLVKGPVSGLQAAGAFNLGGGGHGVQSAGAFNSASGDWSGLQAAGLFNLSLGRLEGAQLAAGLNYAGPVEGVQAAAGLNYAEAVEGVQAAAGFNYAKSFEGAQLAAGFNTAREPSAGLQAAAGFNVATSLDGLQLAAGLNLAREVGTQIGIVNVSRATRGLQLGIVNVAGESGASLGLVNIIRDGYLRVGLSTSELLMPELTLKSGGKLLYTYLSAGISPDRVGLWDDELTDVDWSTAAGIGLHFDPTEHLLVDVDLGGKTFFHKFEAYPMTLVTLRAVAGVAFGRLGLFAGPTLNTAAVWDDTPALALPRLGGGKARKAPNVYPGLVAGVQL